MSASWDRGWVGLAAVTVTLVVVGCAPEGPRAATSEELRQVRDSAAAVRDAHTARVTVLFEARRGRGVVLSSEITGRVDFAGGRVHLELENPWHRYFRDDLRPGSPLRFELIAEGSDWYVHVADNPAAFGLGWAAVDASGLPTGLYPFPRPQVLLDALPDIDNLELIGEEIAEGTTTTRYRAEVPAQALREVFPDQDATLHAEILVGETGPLHSVRYVLEQDRLSLSMTVTFSDLGTSPPVTLPDDITWQLTVGDFDQLEAMFRQMGLGGIGSEN